VIMSHDIKILDSNLQITSTLTDQFTKLAEYEIKPVLLSQVIRAEMSNQRTSNAHTKDRSEVRGGGKKPWKQKGTGRARHGSRRSPIWVGGGVTFGPRNTTNWHLKINKSARLSALKTILKDRLILNNIYTLESSFDFPKTSPFAASLDKLAAELQVKPKKIVILYTTTEKEHLKGCVNTEIQLINAANIKLYELLNCEKFVFTSQALDLINQRIS
jgi:large subunit ribosomal protein L4